MKISVIYIIILTAMITSCSNKKEADLIVHNGLIYTVNASFEISESFAVKDGKIVAVGTSQEILSDYDAVEKINLKGKPVYPGFIDAHCHFYRYGQTLREADLNGTESFEEVLMRVKKHSDKMDLGWITGRGWDQNDWNIKEFPKRSVLDSMFPDKPVFLIRVDGHAGLANKKALEFAGIDKDTEIPGGKIFKENGELTGMLIDNAMDSVYSKIPDPDRQQNIIDLQNAEKNCFAVGLTTVDDAGLDKDIIDLIDEMHQSGALKMRLYIMLSPTEANEHYFKTGPHVTDRLSVRSLKLYADGALGSRGALLKEDYSDDPGNKGLQLHDEEYFRSWAKKCIDAGLQLNTHCIGDRANELILDIYGGFLKEKNDLRWRIEHAQVTDTKDISKFGEYTVIPSIQTTHATSDMYWAGERLGPERVKYAYAYKELLDQNGMIANGSDFPIEHINPLYGFYAAVARKDHKGYPEDGFQVENALSRQEALMAMTIWPAIANFEETQKGSIDAGKVADFVILEEDIMKVEIDKVPDIKVEATYVNGEKVY